MSEENLVNYAEEPEFVKANRRKDKRLRIVALVLLAIALALAGAGAYLMWEAGQEEAAVRSLSDVAALPEPSGDDPSGEPDWEAVEEETGTPATMWVQVPNRGIDFAVAQWGDNEYGLHHDIYGNYSWAGVFLDCDADPNGLNKVIYGHTLYGGGMFTDLAQSRYQSEFDGIGTVRYATPERGWVELTPVASIDVPAEDTSIRTFEFGADPASVESATASMLASKKQAGKANTKVDPFGKDTATMTCVPDEGVLDPARSVKLTEDTYYVLTDEDMAACEESARKSAFRDWLGSMVGRADAKSADAERLVSQADECVVLACCSWPFHNTRTLVIAVA